ncbi:MAG: hypothetical protein EBY22_13415, partial [Gammaproteobacteria bacterium]|nr:hypothetical protein [Gammaproteobacteria bacterium]
MAHDNTVTRFDCGDGRFGRCLGLAFSASNGVFIVRDAQRLELFNVVRTSRFNVQFQYVRYAFKLHFVRDPHIKINRDGRAQEPPGLQHAR